MSTPPAWSREIPVAKMVGWARMHPVGLALAAGVVCRLAGYLADRPYWMDEGSLIACIGDLGRTGLFGPLGSSQLAPPGFLGLEWLATRLVGASSYGYRLVPLVAGIAALFLFRAVARRSLSPRGAAVAVALFAVADDLIYFASEVKQYSSDLALSLLCLAAAARREDGPTSVREAAALAAAGAGLLWFSHPAVFTLAAVGVVGLARAVRGREWRRAALWSATGLAWVASVAAVHAVAMRQLGHQRGMWLFWDFAFPVVPPRSLWDLTWPIRRVLFLFASPLNFDAPFGPYWSIWPAVALAAVGTTRMLRADPTQSARLALPMLFALLASSARLYPFHGRLLLFAAPLLLLPIASGVDAIGPRGWRRLAAAWVVGFPAMTAAYHLAEPRQREANPYGDRRPSTLNPYWFPLAAPPSYVPRPRPS